MDKNSIKCNHCTKEITSSEDLVIAKWYSFLFKKYHKECYEQVVDEHQNRVSKPIDIKANAIMLIILNIAILVLMFITTGTSKLTFLGLLLLAFVGLDLPYLVIWFKVVKPLKNKS